MSYIAARTEGTAGAPLFLTFHGTGGTELQFHRLASELIPAAHVSSPRGDVSELGALRYFRRSGEGVYDMVDLARATVAMADFIAAEVERTAAPRVIGLGYSNGANILAATAFGRPELIDDLILLHPLIPFEPAPQPGLSGRRVLITAGRNDPICPPRLTETLIAYFRHQGADATAHWHPGGHAIESSELEAIRSQLAQDQM
jgi:phospholipase/carboxylesterase